MTDAIFGVYPNPEFMTPDQAYRDRLLERLPRKMNVLDPRMLWWPIDAKPVAEAICALMKGIVQPEQILGPPRIQVFTTPVNTMPEDDGDIRVEPRQIVGFAAGQGDLAELRRFSDKVIRETNIVLTVLGSSVHLPDVTRPRPPKPPET